MKERGAKVLKEKKKQKKKGQDDKKDKPKGLYTRESEAQLMLQAMAFNEKVIKLLCCPVRYFWTLFWDDITKIWEENLLIFTFLSEKLRKNLFWTNKKFVYLNIITNFCPKIHCKYIHWKYNETNA